jgi:hypothetical protein
MAEAVLVADVERDLSRILDKGMATYFFPAVSRTGTFVRESPYANYVFVATGVSDSKILRLENSRFVDSILCVPGSAGRWRTVTKLSDQELAATAQLAPIDVIEEGSEVSVISGEWTGLTGYVLTSFGAQVKVSLQLRSRRRILVLSREEITRL